MTLIHIRAAEIATADVKTKYGRIYPRSLLEEFVIRHSSPNTMIMGEFGGNQTQIDDIATHADTLRVEQISHRIHNLRMKGDKLVADIEVLTGSKMGSLMILQLDEVMFRLRGLTSWNTGAGVVRDFDIIAIDAYHHTLC